ncbi:MAG: DUF1851 domain-containing protein [Gammaproteobacteria bacterium]|nr:DUF1851 domain-containing protein [Gammaproteobacteria bacterium]MDH5650630.1 DUF1851 domain-containing protein [Gammaproteobacteria bacterium]
MSIQLQKFIEKHTPGENLQKADPEKTARYREYLPGPLLELWAEYGFGLYGGGLIQVIDPDLYRDNLWGWLMREEEDMSRLPIALSAFGDIFYYRLLSDDGDEDVAFLDPHTSEGECIVWSLEEFFNEWCCDEEVVSEFLNLGMFQESVAAKGQLEENQFYYFVPALRMGGARSVAGIDRGDAVVHLDFLLQLALDE